jgi:hypothetical protein
VANENGTPVILTLQQRNHVADVWIHRHGLSELASASSPVSVATTTCRPAPSNRGATRSHVAAVCIAPWMHDR